jgi:hypothetical protein
MEAQPLNGHELFTHSSSVNSSVVDNHNLGARFARPHLPLLLVYLVEISLRRVSLSLPYNGSHRGYTRRN